mmetsp:Transcript_18355/g.28640  ORF Transcript_18355/g.28640 Transcript_18355/m.28640 type:complete len:107 (+) Transcript_18355:45-365(+)
MDSDSMNNGMQENNDDPTESLPTKKMMKLRVSLVVVSVIIGAVVRKFAYLAVFVGSVLTPYAGFILPSILFVGAHKKAKKPFPWTETAIAYFILFFGSALAVVGGC